MSKRELIDRIRLLNRSAREAFLQAFTEDELAAYLQQLESIKPRNDPGLTIETSNN
ncbi:MAG: hypothetical protein MI923_01525 [Phycisphaerales bacterium]|nr:hypothetical protein [Phycisphaerales bacterium]